MTYELVKVELTNSTGFPRRFTVASNASITKGSILTLSDPRTAALASSANTPIAGIAAMDKDGTDYSTTITAWTDGVFEARASGAITVGDMIVCAAGTGFSNTVKALLTAVASGAAIMGYALETASDGETINVRVRL